MWAPNADTGGSTVNFTPWWPGAAHVGMVGLDGYPQGGSGWGLCNFRELLGRSFTEMKSLTRLPVFISETDLAPLSTTGERHLFRACGIPGLSCARTSSRNYSDGDG